MLIAAAVLSGCTSKPTCDATAVDHVLSASASAPQELRRDLLTMGLDEACTGTELPWARATPDQRERLMADAIRKDPSAWRAACAGGPSVLDALAPLAPVDRAIAAHEQCKLDRFGIPPDDVVSWGDELLLRITAIGLAQSLDDTRKASVMSHLTGPVVVTGSTTTDGPAD